MQFLKPTKGIFLATISRAISLIICGVIALLPVHESQAQDQPIYNQFFLNPFIYNPAYAGKNPNSMAYLNHRQQWVGIEGAPVSYTLMYDLELNKGVSFGVIVQNDSRGIISTNSAQFTIGYGVKFDVDQGLRLGLSAGAGTNNLDLDNGIIDIAVQNALNNNFFFTGRLGVNYYFRGLNLSFSLPDIFKRKLLSTLEMVPTEIDPLSNFIGMASVKFNLVPKTLAFSPHLLYRGLQDGTNYLEAVGVFDIKEAVWIGGSYRQNSAVVGLVGMKVKNKFSLGYSYEIPTSSISAINNSTHEIQLSFRLGKDKIKEVEVNRLRIEVRKEKQRIAQEAAHAKKMEKAQIERIKKESAEQRRLLALEQKHADSIIVDDQITHTEVDPADELPADHYVIVGAFNTPQNANKYARQLKRKGYNAAYGYSTQKQRYYVHIYKSPSAEEARNQRDNFRRISQFKDAWHLEVLPNDIKDIENKSYNEADLDEPIVVKKGKHRLELSKGHYAVIGAFSSFEESEKFSYGVFKNGFENSLGFSSQTQLYYVFIYIGDTAKETRIKIHELRKISSFENTWHLIVE
jgi:type IX secretion system PorP/SprF family membrane protein